MPQVLKLSWAFLDRLVAGAKRDPIICAPLISPAGLKQPLPNHSPARPLQRLQPWARVTDPRCSRKALCSGRGPWLSVSSCRLNLERRPDSVAPTDPPPGKAIHLGPVVNNSPLTRRPRAG